jgi:hypothetical protein
MLRKFRAIDSPDANGRQPQFGDQKWTLTIPLENGDDYLEVEIGKRGRDGLLAMLRQEEEDDADEGEVE